MFKVQITGIKALDKKLREFEPKIAKKIVRKAMRKGLKVMLERARQLAPVGPTREWHLRDQVTQHQGGLLRKSMKLRAARSRKSIRFSILLKTSAALDAWYGTFVELGTKRIRARRFMRDAFEQTKSQVRDTTIAEIMAGIETEAKS